MTTDIRALCAELTERLEWFIAEDDTNENDPDNQYWLTGKQAGIDSVARARAALAEGAGVGLTDEPPEEEPPCWYDSSEAFIWKAGFVEGWRTAHPQAPIPVAERLPTEADCDAEGQCWWWDSIAQVWTYLNREQAERAGYYTYAYPAAAIPLPRQENTND